MTEPLRDVSNQGLPEAHTVSESQYSGRGRKRQQVHERGPANNPIDEHIEKLKKSDDTAVDTASAENDVEEDIESLVVFEKNRAQ